MTLSENSRDSEQDLRWLAWEEKNRRADRIVEKRMKLVFVVVSVILLLLIVYASLQVRKRPDVVKKGPAVACQWTAAIPSAS
jgi:hypothetical protein